MIQVRILRPCLFRGSPVAADTELPVEPLLAGDLINSGRAKRVDIADLGVIVDAQRTDSLRMTREPLQSGRFVTTR